MATEKEKVAAERILRAAAAMFGGMLAGMASPGMIGPGGLGTGTATRILEGAAPGTVADYPTPNNFHYHVDWVDAKKPEENASYKAHPDSRATRMQTIQEHNRALNRYIRPGMGPLELRAAIEKGKEEERKLASFWTDDSEPRRPVRSSSTAVSDVHINPDGTLSVRFRQQGKWYTYAGGADPYEAAMAAHDLVTAPSLGRAINKKTGWWSVGDHHKIW